MAKEKAKHDGLLCFLLALIVVLILVIGGGAYYFLVVDNGEEIVENENTDNNIKQEENNSNVLTKINNSKEIVYSIEKEQYLEYLDKTIINKIPVVNINSETIKHINKEIEGNYENRPEYLDMCDYNYYVNNDILSLVIKKDHGNYEGLQIYDVYNIDINKGVLLDDTTLLYTLKKDTNSLIERVKEIIKEQDYKYDFDKEFVKQQYNRTVYEIVNDKNIRYFLDETGTLNFIVKRYNLAGGEATYVIYELKDTSIINKTSTYKRNNVEYKELLANTLNESEAVYITSIEKNNDKYEIKGVKFSEYTLTETELNQLKNGDKIIIDNKEYVYTDRLDDHDKRADYLKLNTNDVSSDYLYITNKEYNKYVLGGNTEFYVNRKMTDEYYKITLDSTTKYIEYDVWNDEKKCLENKETSIAEFYNNFTFKEPQDVTHPDGIYKFDFEGAKCVSFSYIETSH